MKHLPPPPSRTHRLRPAARAARRVVVPAVAALLSATIAIEPVAWAQELPTLGQAGAEYLTPLEERMYGEQIMRVLRGDPSYLDDPETTDYINRLGYQLVSVSAARDIDFEFFVLRDSTINAFALPGGFIGVHTGLILAAQSESELAAVLAHEIGHVQQRHLARQLAQQRDNALITIGSLLLALLAARTEYGPQAAMAVGQAAAAQRSLAFSRADEREADRVGFQILTAAGFDPQGMVSFFRRMEQGTRAYDSMAPEYLQTHPLTAERIADMMGRVRQAGTHQHADSLDFQLIRARLRVLQDESTSALQDRIAGFTYAIEHHTELTDTASYYGLAAAYLDLNRPAPALAAALAARKSTRGDSSVLDDMVAEASYQAAKTPAQREDALALAKADTNRYPLSQAVALEYVDMLQRAHHDKRAIAYMQNQLAIPHSDPDYYGYLAKSYSALNEKTRSHQATAEMYVLLGSTTAAVEQLRLAHKIADADFYTMTEVDARLHELTAKMQQDAGGAKKSQGGGGGDGDGS